MCGIDAAGVEIPDPQKSCEIFRRDGGEFIQEQIEIIRPTRFPVRKISPMS